MKFQPFRGVPNDEEFLNNVTTAIGFVVFASALAEFAMNSIVATIYHTMNGKNLVNGRIPIDAKHVGAFLKDSARKVPELEEHRKDLREIAIEAKRLASIRNGVVHGYLADYDETKNHRLIFCSISAYKPPHDMHHERLLTITAADLMAGGSDLLRLSERAGHLSRSLMEPPVAKKSARETTGRIRRKTLTGRKSAKPVLK